MASIKAIQQTSVHQIQSGQVIVDLNSVVKELVENSLDAGATSIEVRFRNHGLDAIEVVDNGSGIAPDDYQSVALKHHTSKLVSYDDLESLDTFGFRGEALASLCALSQLHVVTAREGEAPKGTRLEFEVSGKLKNATVVATQRGTKVVVESLFHNLPVRKKELEKNIKREYGKVLGLLQAYACISTGVRFVVSNQMPKAAKSIAFATSINNNTKDNITNVFGAKTLHALIKLDLKLVMNPSRPGLSTQTSHIRDTQSEISTSRDVTVQGHISRPVFGDGRQAPDRQFFFVNSRPCALPQVAKAVNEVYRSFNVSQSPFIFANLVMDTHAYDVNVSPDKRTILLHDQSTLLESLKEAMLELFEMQEQSVPQSKLASATQAKLPAYKPLTVARQSKADTTVSTNSQALLHNPERPRGGGRPTQMSPQSDEESAAGAEDEDKDTRRRFESPDSQASLDEGVATSFPSQRGPPERLIHNWMERSTVSREALPTSRPRTVQSSPHPTPDSVPNAFDRMRPPRTPAQVAEITIGDRTMTTIIGTGSPAFKKRRIHTPKTPVLSKSLRGFAMPGSQMEAEVDDDDDDEEDGMEEDESRDEDEDVEEQAHEAERGPHEEGVASRENSIDDISDDDGLEDDVQMKDTSDGSAPLVSAHLNTQERQTQEYIVRRKVFPPPPPHFVEESSDEDEMDEEDNSIIQDLSFMEKEATEYEQGSQSEEQDRARSDDSDEDYLDENQRRSRDNEKITRLMQQAEQVAARPSADNVKRANQAMRGTSGSKHSVLNLSNSFEASLDSIKQLAVASLNMSTPLPAHDTDIDNTAVTDDISKDSADAEAQLSLTVAKSDFATMIVAGQFNLGFIIALRPNAETGNDDLFIIDQHAADEKYNFERFARTLTLQPQRLAQPKQLYLTAVEEEIVLSHSAALTANGFLIETDTSGDAAVGERCKLISLPTSKEKTFDLSDLEELLHLLSDHPESSSYIPRPGKVRRMLAMRACRSSIMVGKTLTTSQMVKVVRNLGEMDKPWNCPHGRPTMRHLAGLGGWAGWDGVPEWEKEDATTGGGKTDWTSWLRKRKVEIESDNH